VQSINWQEQYRALAAELLRAAPTAKPLLAGFNAFVDAIYPVHAGLLERLQSEAQAPVAGGTQGAMLASEILGRTGEGRGGALCLNWSLGPAWALRLFGDPAFLQLGGTGPQAAWALATLGAPAVVALTDRSAEQLSVLPSGVRLSEAGRLVAAGELSARTPPRKPRNIILELTEGTRWSGGSVRRSTRIMLRFLDSGIERDESFASTAKSLAPQASACLVSGLDAIDRDDQDSIPWLLSLLATLRRNGLKHAHLELAEFPLEGRMEEVCVAFGGVVDSLGMSLSELGMLTARRDQPVAAAREVAFRYGFERVFVHADHWSLAVHRGDSGKEMAALMAGNLLASARAHEGRPSSTLTLSPDAEFREDVPPPTVLDGGWRADCAPAPYLHRPRATIGLGDTFVGGLLLAAGLPRLRVGF
jgi:ADP-dependent phosphofructokinase/glucokinase